MDPEEISKITEKLEELTQTEESYVLISKNGERFDLPMLTLSRCSFIEERIKESGDSREITLDVSFDVLYMFEAFLKNITIDDIYDIFDMMKFAYEINCPEFAHYCVQYTVGVTVPDDTPLEVALSVLSQIVKFLPIRTPGRYRDLLKRFKRAHLKDCTATVMHVLKHEALYDNMPLAIPIFLREVTVCLMEDFCENKMVAVLLNNNWVPIKIFGPYFCPFEAQVTSFHLCFNKYVIYQTTDGSVKMKNLKTDDPEEELFTSAKFFRSRCHQLHLIRQHDDTARDVLYEWNHDTMEFEQKFSHPRMKLKSAYRDIECKLIAFTSMKQKLNFLNEECTLVDSWLQPGGEYIDSWEINENDTYCSKYCRREDKYQLEQLNAPFHIGYTCLGTETCPDGFYRTKIVRRVDFSSEVKYTLVHGKVIATSDVLLL